MDLEKKKEFARKFFEFMKQNENYGVLIAKEDFEHKTIFKIITNKFDKEMKICFISKNEEGFKKLFNNPNVNIIVGAPYAIGVHKLYMYDINNFYIKGTQDRYDLIIIDELNDIKGKEAENLIEQIKLLEFKKIIVINYNTSKIPKALNKLSPIVIDLIGEQVGYLSNIIQSINKIRY